jgi:putative transposase
VPRYRRYSIPGACVFVTCVTHHRRPFFRDPVCIRAFETTCIQAQRRLNFRLLAHALLPDHFHGLIQLAHPEADFSKILHALKRETTVQVKQRLNIRGEFHFWQPRFWDHIIRDEDDFDRHADWVGAGTTHPIPSLASNWNSPA